MTLPLWIPLSIAAAFFQNVRSVLQKLLKAPLSTLGATYSRFLFAFPFAILYVTGLAAWGGFEMPRPTATFAIYVTIGSLAQVVGTALLIHLFSFRNFIVGTSYSKTEAIQTAVFGMVILGERVSMGAVVGILASLVGVIAISVAKIELDIKRLMLAWTQRTAVIGLASGTFFSLATVCFRAAPLSLGQEMFFVRAAFTMVCAITLQALFMGVYLRIREPGEFTRVVRSVSVSVWVGLCGILASIGWFTALTIQNAAYVRAVGQIELIFTLISSYAFFRERATATEIVGIVLVIGGILAVLLS